MRTQRMPSAERRIQADEMVAQKACTVIDRDRVLSIPPDAWTLDGFRAWATSDEVADLARFTFIGGELFIDMSPEEINHHGAVKTEIARVIANIAVRRNCGVYLPDRTLVTNVSANLSTEPDGAFAFFETLESGKLRLVPRKDEAGESVEAEGSPDWVLEIVSKHSERKDTQQLREKYHKAQISEYWLVRARERKLDFQILRRDSEEYVGAARRRDWQRSQVFGLYFRLERVKGRAGTWRYTLHACPKPPER